MDHAVESLVASLQGVAPVGETGETRRQIERRQVSGPPRVEHVITALTDAASYTEEGTQPHQIKGNPLLAFEFTRIGRFVIVASVDHPGNPARPWFFPTLRSEFVPALQRASITIR